MINDHIVVRGRQQMENGSLCIAPDSHFNR